MWVGEKEKRERESRISSSVLSLDNCADIMPKFEGLWVVLGTGG